MAPSFWSDLQDWTKETLDSAKEFVDEIWNEMVNNEEGNTTTASASSTASSFTKWETSQSSYLQTSIPTDTPTSILTSISRSNPTSIPTKILSSTSYNTLTTTSPASTSRVNGSSATETDMHHSSVAPGLNNNFHFILIGLAVGVLGTIIVYLLTPIAIRFFQFAFNFTKVCISGNTSFVKDTEAGLSSEAFSLAENIDGEDGRNGLEKKAKLRILWYMFIYGESFDESRLRYVRYKFAQNGIGPDGQPLDPKYFSNL